MGRRMTEPLLRILGICLALAGAETLHGIARMRLLVPRVGLRVAQRISILTGSLLAFLICLLTVPATGIRGPKSLLLLGLVLATFMAAFDIALGRLVARRSWSVVLADFNLFEGHLLPLGLFVLALSPLVAMALRG